MGPPRFYPWSFTLSHTHGWPPSGDGVGENIVCYADDVSVWTADRDVDVVETNLNLLAAKFVEFAARNGLSLNHKRPSYSWRVVGTVKREGRGLR
ncbi:Hypothetical protein FKW44_008345 [Caligus rogercresseyi]|uniref:Reverse transcriptase domain-containing protein n=1 Tax=Caligus rogercresseyi TaxID=217165 RepID=A0A7T8QU67_CALRO|nr:Hypothetical protein FKW44_008345 [Caligus rogercresseyi]